MRSLEATGNSWINAMKEEKEKLSLRGISLNYTKSDGEQIAVLENVNLDLRANEFLCLMGPSGCGKTSLLNIAAGLVNPSKGQILVDGKPVIGSGIERGVVFQEYALFPWKTVLDNIA